jgi:hypothetical protein
MSRGASVEPGHDHPGVGRVTGVGDPGDLATATRETSV